MTTLYARISDGVLLDGPVTAADILERSVPPEWYTPVSTSDCPPLVGGQYIAENYTISDSTLHIQYVACELDLQGLFAVVRMVKEGDYYDQTIQPLLRKGEQAVFQALDAFAQTRGYDTIDRLISYTTSNVAQRAAEAQVGVNARDALLDAYYAYCARVTAGQAPVPTSSVEIIRALPVLSWPA